MRRALLTLSLICLMAALAPAQQAKLGVKGIEPNDDVIYGSLIREDANGIPAAVVRVKLPIEGAGFDGDLIGDPLFDVNEYIVWLEAGCRMVEIKCPRAETLRVYFEDYGVERLESKTGYTLRLDVPAALLGMSGENGIFTLLLKPTYASVSVDGRVCTATDGVVAEALPYGEHVWSAGAPGYKTSEGKFTLSPERRNFAINLELTPLPPESEQPDPVKMCAQALALLDQGKKKEGISLLGKAADSGDDKAQEEMGRRLLYGIDVKKNVAEGLRYLRMAADQGRYKSAFRLAHIYSQPGIFLPKEKKMQRDYKEAAHWYEMTIKNAPAGDKSTLSDALCNLGIYYLEGKGVARDERKGVELLERAAALGDIIAALRLKNLSQSKGSE